MRTRLPQLLALHVILAIWPAAVRCEDWPTFRGDNKRSGVTSEEPILRGHPLWVWRSTSAPVTSMPGPKGRTYEGRELRHKVRFDDALQVVISGRRVVFGSSIDGRIISLDLERGTRQWEFFTGAAVRLAPSLHQGKVYAGSDDGFVYCLDVRNGRLIWRHRAAAAEEFVLARGRMTSRWPVRTGVLVADGVAYFGAGVFPHDRVYHCALDALTGEVKWKHDKISEADLGRYDASPQGYLLASDRYVFVPQGRDLPGALDMRTGGMIHKRWHTWGKEAQGDVGGTAALLADGQIYHFGTHQIMAMSQKRGDIGFGWLNGRQLVVAGDKGYLANGEKISRFNRMEYLEESRKHTAKLKRLREVEKERRAAGADPARKAEFDKLMRERAELKKATRTRVIRVEPDWATPCPHEGEMILAGNLLIAGGQKEVVALDASTGEKVWKSPLEGEARGLAAAGGHLLVSTTAGHIHCYGPAADARTRQVGPGSRDPDYMYVPQASKQEARRILELTGVRRGYCLLFGIGDGTLAISLATASELTIYAVDADEDVVARARRLMRERELLGDRVRVHHVKDGRLPYANYFADLVVSQAMLCNGAPQVRPSELLRALKPGGGVVCLPEEIPGEAGDFLASLRGAGDGYAVEEKDGRLLVRREHLSGVDWWTHQYANPGNTAGTNDTRVRGGLRVLWYGDPGAGQMISRHDGAMSPLCVNGRMFVQGRFALMAFDAYNGLFLWERENPKARKNGTKGGFRPSHIAADSDFIFMAEEDRCYQLAAATGREVHAYTLPTSAGKEPRHWGVVGLTDGILYGTSVLPHEPRMHWHRLALKYRVKPADLAFAFDIRDHRLLWTYQGESIQHSAVAAGEGHVFFVDSALTPAQRAAMLREPKVRLASLTGDARRQAEKELKRRDLRLAVSLHARTGRPRWQEPIDVTDCSGVSIASGSLVMMYSDGRLIFCGADSNGHYWEQFLKGEFKRRKLAVHDARTGKEIWAKGANYRVRPLVVGDRIFAEPWAYRLADGELCTRRHPETNAEEVWEFNRPSAHCGMMTGSPHMLLFRAFSFGFYDLERDAGVQWLAGHRLGCWVNAIPAGGLVLAPESSAGCSCLFPISCTVVLEPAAGYPRVGKPIWRKMDKWLGDLKKRIGIAE